VSIFEDVGLYENILFSVIASLKSKKDWFQALNIINQASSMSWPSCLVTSTLQG